MSSRHTMSPGKGIGVKLRNRASNLQRSSVLPNYNREKSRQSTSSLRYTNSLPTGQAQVHRDIPLHLRQSIDKIGSERTDYDDCKLNSHIFIDEPPAQGLTQGHQRTYKREIIEYYEDINQTESPYYPNSPPAIEHILLRYL